MGSNRTVMLRYQFAYPGCYLHDATTCPSSGSLRPRFLAIPGNQVLWWFWTEPTNPASLRHMSGLHPGSFQTRSTLMKPLSAPHVQPPPGSSGLDRRRPLDGFDPPGPIKLARVLAIFVPGVDHPHLHVDSAVQVPGYPSPPHGRRCISYTAACSPVHLLRRRTPLQGPSARAFAYPKPSSLLACHPYTYTHKTKQSRI